ncbi:Acyl-CoA dehydrogenase member 10 [Perkinsus chesapeaki]|uniref:Acyl-CoA dehydrogenase member 10 n=1 Tax=Perkinsus chesapeaki TaxID=330153 RepID=A0A7J6M1Q8_PERCH|nr:Acyl-CoA dehydrogenase member 10 [Perkinsus chesapeaki]
MVDNASAMAATPTTVSAAFDETKGLSNLPGAAVDMAGSTPKNYREPKSFVSPTVASTANGSSPRHVSFDNYINEIDHEELSDVLNRLLPSLDYLETADITGAGDVSSSDRGVLGEHNVTNHPSLDLSALSDSVFEDYHEDHLRHFSADGDLTYTSDLKTTPAYETQYGGDAGGSSTGDSDEVGEMVEKVVAAFVDAQKELEEEREKRRQLELENEVMRMRIRTLSSVGSVTSSRHGSISYAAALNNGVNGAAAYGDISPRGRAMTAALDSFGPIDSEVAPPPPGLLEHQMSAPPRSYGLTTRSGYGHNSSWDVSQRRSSSGALSHHQQQQMQPVSPTTPPKMNLLEALQVKTEADEKRVFTVRKVHKLGFKARHILREYFSKFGHVRDVVLLPMRAKPRPGPGGIVRGPRPSSMGFVVMSSPEEVRRVLDVDGVHIVRGLPSAPAVMADHAKRVLEDLNKFVDEIIKPGEHVYRKEHAEGSSRWASPPVMERMKDEAKKRGLWNLFIPKHFPESPGLTTYEYAHLCELMGKHLLTAEATNCSAPDTGNMEVLLLAGSKDQKERWLKPLLEGSIRSTFLMTEPNVASSDASNISIDIRKDGYDYVINGTKWWSSGALDERCRVGILLGKVGGGERRPAHQQQSMLVIPMDAPGIRVVRALTVFGYDDAPHGHALVEFDNVRVSQRDSLLGREGDGFKIAQARLGPGRIHHCMRLVGMAERALEIAVDRAHHRRAFGKLIAHHGGVMTEVAECRIEIEAARALVLRAAAAIDAVGVKGALNEIAAIKVFAPRMACKVIDRCIQICGGAGVSGDLDLAFLYTAARPLRIADGPDAVHLATVAKHEYRMHAKKAATTSRL